MIQTHLRKLANQQHAIKMEKRCQAQGHQRHHSSSLNQKTQYDLLLDTIAQSHYPEDSTKQEIHAGALRNTGIIFKD